LQKRSPIPMQVFQGWFAALHADLLPPGHPAFAFLDFFTDIQKMTPEQRKRGAAAVIARLSQQPDLLADPGTEPLLFEE
jgi:hypothetical protein